MSNISKLNFLNENLWKIISIIVLAFLVLQINYIFLIRPDFVEKWMKRVKTEEIPKVLQVVQGELIGNDIEIKVVKKISKQGIYLEIFNKSSSGLYQFMNTIQLKGKYDSFFEYWGKTLSLALIDQDGNGQLDIVAPTTDETFKPHINIISYSKESKNFELSKTSKVPEFR